MTEMADIYRQVRIELCSKGQHDQVASWKWFRRVWKCLFCGRTVRRYK